MKISFNADDSRCSFLILLFPQVTATKQWAQVGRAIGVGGKTCTSLSHSIKAAYTKWVYPYEDFIAKHGSPAPTRPGTPDLGQQDSDGTPTTRGKRAKREKKLLKRMYLSRCICEEHHFD